MRIIDNIVFGDILLADFVFSDQQGSKLRPCLVLYRKGEDLVVLKMTSQATRAAHIPLEPDTQNHLKITTNVDLHTIVALQKDLFHKKLGRINSTTKEHIRHYRSQFPLKW